MHKAEYRRHAIACNINTTSNQYLYDILNISISMSFSSAFHIVKYKKLKNIHVLVSCFSYEDKKSVHTYIDINTYLYTQDPKSTTEKQKR